MGISTVSGPELLWSALSGVGLAIILGNLQANRRHSAWLDETGLNGPRRAAVDGGVIAQGILLAFSAISLALGFLALASPEFPPRPHVDFTLSQTILAASGEWALMALQALAVGLSLVLRRTRIKVLQEIDAEEALVAAAGGVPIRKGRPDETIVHPGAVESIPPPERPRGRSPSIEAGG